MLYNIKTTEFSGTREAESIEDALQGIKGSFLYAIRQPDDSETERLRNILLDSGGIKVHPNDIDRTAGII